MIAGANAQGKTSILEALFLASTGQLLRGGRDAEAIRNGEADATVELTIQPSGTTIRVELRAGIRKRILVNDKPLARASDIMGRLPIVTFSMEDLEVVRGEPGARRRFLDVELSQHYPNYLKSFATYRRSLEQRNALLKEAQERNVPGSEFEPWELSLAESGEDIRRRRQAFVTDLAPAVSAFMRDLGNESIELGIQASDEEPLLGLLESGRANDIRRGSTSVGPHRDDLRIFVQGVDIRAFGSQGQQRSAVMALKAGVFNVAGELHGEPPTLLLDDVFSDLDAGRRQRLVRLVRETSGQVLITCTEPEQAGTELLESARVFRVSEGAATLWNG
ncbi:MAG: DNA replication and repair protein RecF [Fimbriimonadaceae bacterium]|nr:DNA replication and repair protein RecF [Fimbriimonadaceae bacterium]